jgi:solute:Na+ symporter, SSS family
MVGMTCGFALEVYVWLATPVAWTWYVVIGTLTTFGIGYIASLALPERERRT